MKIETALYLADICSSISAVCTMVIFLSIMLFFGCFLGKLFNTDSRYDDEKKLYTIFDGVLKKWMLILPVIIIGCAIPSKKTMYLMMGASYLQESKLPTKVSRALELKIDEYIDEMTNKEMPSGSAQHVSKEKQ